MATKENARRKLSQISLILMIFTSVFGFTNMPRSFYLMGYGAIPWYILSGITFFIPYAFMMAEYVLPLKKKAVAYIHGWRNQWDHCTHLQEHSCGMLRMLYGL
ncbi:hypothetical protein PQ689_13015 [Thermoanaerobacterium thermosaccharolyticum]|uniref:hypothetical protein n=1 Tax=Thermoanaerobacterium thermosaccharolyticum TaxID=1517 RepID=UPI003DA94B01